MSDIYDINDKVLLDELKSKYNISKNVVLTKNDKAWLCLIDKYDILNKVSEESHFIIKSKEINQLRESRLMAKFDHSINLPIIFKKNNLSILPISRGSYIIAKMNTYHPLKISDENIQYTNVPSYLQSLDFKNINSESVALNCALATDILTDFLEDERLIPTISGRMGSGSFSFEIGDTKSNRQNINVKNSQIEIDAGVEGTNYLTLIEAKRNIADDFLVRQLYYPYKTWSKKVKKRIKSVYLIYSDGIFHLNEYVFEDPNRYDSIQLVKSKKYSFERVNITLDEIINVSNQRITEEPKISFPQADNFDRIINLGELLKENDKEDLTREAISENYAFDVRQTNYYTDALRYLGLAQRDYLPGRIPYYYLTEEGVRIFNLSYRNRKIELIKKILEHEVFNKVFKEWLKFGQPSKEKVVSLMKESNLYRINSKSTYNRRASTIIQWIKWIFNTVEV